MNEEMYIRHEMTLGHQVQNYRPPVSKKYSPLKGDIEEFFSGDVASLVSRKLPG